MNIKAGQVLAVASVIDIVVGLIVVTTRIMPISWALLGVALILIGALLLTVGLAVQNEVVKNVVAIFGSLVSFMLVFGSVITILFYRLYYMLGPLPFLIVFYLIVPLAMIGSVVYVIWKRFKKPNTN